MPGRRRIAFICFNTDFFLRHLLPVVNAARANSFEIFALLPSIPNGAADLLQDVTVICIGGGRGKHQIIHLAQDVISIGLALRKSRPDIAQAFSLQACVAFKLASLFVTIPRKIFTITGLGLIDIDTRWANRLLRPFICWLIRRADAGSACFVFENAFDPARLGFRDGRPKQKLTLMGAGVDPSIFPPHTMPAIPPLKIAIVSRMIWSKGVDLGVEAITRLIARGVPVELDIYGAPDFANQRYFPVTLLQLWGRRPGIRWHGFVGDIASVWREHHAGLFPSRGGEGLPRALLEAASCGRALIAANVPGCADFVRPGLEGIIVEPNSVEALEYAIETLVQKPNLLESMGSAARQRVLENSTEEMITSQYRQLFTELSDAR